MRRPNHRVGRTIGSTDYRGSTVHVQRENRDSPSFAAAAPSPEASSVRPSSSPEGFNSGAKIPDELAY